MNISSSRLEEVLPILHTLHLMGGELESFRGLEKQHNGRTKAKLANLRGEIRTFLIFELIYLREEEVTCSPGDSLRGGASLLEGNLYLKEVFKKVSLLGFPPN